MYKSTHNVYYVKLGIQLRTQPARLRLSFLTASFCPLLYPQITTTLRKKLALTPALDWQISRSVAWHNSRLAGSVQCHLCPVFSRQTTRLVINRFPVWVVQ